MKQLPCPRCGSKEVIGTFCKSCLKHLHPLVTNTKEIAVTLCERCGRIRDENKWIDVDRALEAQLRRSLTFADDAHIDGVDFVRPTFELKPGLRKTDELSVTVTGHHEDAPAPYDESYVVPCVSLVTLCDACKKEGTQYYEGILQMRHEHAKARAVIRAYLQTNAKKGLHCTKEVSVGADGTDYYLSNNRAVGHLARQLHKEFGGELKVNAQHFSQDRHTGKILYRTNAFLELPEYTKGDVMLRDGTPYLILGIAATVRAENLLTGATTHFPYKRGEATLLSTRKARVTKAQPLEILHPDTYEPRTPHRSAYAPTDIDAGSEVTVAVDGETLYLIPHIEEERVVEKRQRKRMSQKRASRDRDA